MENLFRNITAIIEVPIKVALQYSHKLTNTPENNAGAREPEVVQRHQLKLPR
jgi:hypothetical protein